MDAGTPARAVDILVGRVEELDVHLCDVQGHAEGLDDGASEFVVRAEGEGWAEEDPGFIVGGHVRFPPRGGSADCRDGG